jgi:hypothetical protein
MFENLTKEIFYYSVIPAAIIALIVLILLFVGKKNENIYYKYNYVIKTSLLLIIGLVLPLIVGYTVWVLERFIKYNLLLSNLFYVILLIVLIVSLIVLLVMICNKQLKGIGSKPEELEEN